MRAFIIATVLASVATFPLVSQAEVSALGVQIPVETPDVSDNLQGGYVAQSLSDTFQVQKLHSSNESEISNASYVKDTYYVFGVALDSNSAI